MIFSLVFVTALTMAQNSHALAEVVDSETTSRGASVRGAKYSNRGLICFGDDCFIHNDDIILPAPRTPTPVPKAPVRAPKAPATAPMALVRAPTALAPGRVTPVPRCIDDAAALSTAIAIGARAITLCYNSCIVLSSPIDLSGKTVEILCSPGPNSRSCLIAATTPTRLFLGNAASVKFRGIAFYGGDARNSTYDGNGGAFCLFDSILELDNCGLVRNTATVSSC
jgi:hypothetical protein